jgi:hypothetical protein
LKYVDSPDIAKISKYKQKYDAGEWLTMSEINDIKRTYSQNFKYTYADNVWKDAVRSKNLQNNLREWQFDEAKKMWLTNIREINKNTQAWRMFSDSLGKKLKRWSANNDFTLTDWIALSWWEPTNLALFLGKKAIQSQAVKQFAIKTLWKSVQNPILKASNLSNKIKPNVINNNILPSVSRISNKSNVKVKPLVLPPWRKQPIITPQTKDAGIILESKKGLKSIKPKDKWEITIYSKWDTAFAWSDENLVKNNYLKWNLKKQVINKNDYVKINSDNILNEFHKRFPKLKW